MKKPTELSCTGVGKISIVLHFIFERGGRQIAYRALALGNTIPPILSGPP